jgi:mRNA-degrading endonuclease YafQ of YafQ-DinJ toxin-antitoxin module
VNSKRLWLNPGQTWLLDALLNALWLSTFRRFKKICNMQWQLIFTDQYQRRALSFIKRHPDAVAQYVKTLELLQVNPHHPSLRLHALKGRLEGLHSISINLKYRITLEMIVTEREIILVNVGDHQQVY